MNFAKSLQAPDETQLPSFDSQCTKDLIDYRQQCQFDAEKYIMPMKIRLRQQTCIVTPNAMMPENQKRCKSDDYFDESSKYGGSSSQENSILVNIKCQSTICAVNWKLPSGFNNLSCYILVELFDENKNLVKVMKMESSESSCQFETLPGFEYFVEVKLVNTFNGCVEMSSGEKQFKAIFSMPEVDNLFDMAVKVAKEEPSQPFTHFYRAKPKIYFDDLIARTNGLMEKYVKDDNGHAASPLNGEIRGLFFSAQLYNGRFPPTSNFGDTRFYINAKELLNPEDSTVYFTDFYCYGRSHCVTLVVCKKGSKTDSYCKHHVKLLNIYNNPFLRAKPVLNGDHIEHEFYVNDKVRVEIFYTESIPLELGRLEAIKGIRIGSALIGGLQNDVTCTVCNPPNLLNNVGLQKRFIQMMKSNLAERDNVNNLPYKIHEF